MLSCSRYPLPVHFACVPPKGTSDRANLMHSWDLRDKQVPCLLELTRHCDTMAQAITNVGASQSATSPPEIGVRPAGTTSPHLAGFGEARANLELLSLSSSAECSPGRAAPLVHTLSSQSMDCAEGEQPARSPSQHTPDTTTISPPDPRKSRAMCDADAKHVFRHSEELPPTAAEASAPQPHMSPCVSTEQIYASNVDVGMVGAGVLDAEQAEVHSLRTPHASTASDSSGSGVGRTRRLSDRSDRGALCPLPENALLGVYACACNVCVCECVRSWAHVSCTCLCTRFHPYARTRMRIHRRTARLPTHSRILPRLSPARTCNAMRPNNSLHTVRKRGLCEAETRRCTARIHGLMRIH